MVLIISVGGAHLLGAFPGCGHLVDGCSGLGQEAWAVAWLAWAWGTTDKRIGEAAEIHRTSEHDESD
jgi:hypothetical protein